MNKRCAFYSFFQDSPTEETLINQGCIKSCIKKKQGPIENPSPKRVLFGDGSRKKSVYVNYLCIEYTLKKKTTDFNQRFFSYIYLIKLLIGIE